MRLVGRRDAAEARTPPLVHRHVVPEHRLRSAHHGRGRRADGWRDSYLECARGAARAVRARDDRLGPVSARHGRNAPHYGNRLPRDLCGKARLLHPEVLRLHAVLTAGIHLAARHALAAAGDPSDAEREVRARRRSGDASRRRPGDALARLLHRLLALRLLHLRVGRRDGGMRRKKRQRRRRE